MVRDNRHDTAYILGAICPARGIGAAIITPAANTECINLHLAEISTHVAAGAFAALIWDGAGWHQSGGELKVPRQYQTDPAAALRSRAKRDGKCLGVSACQQTVRLRLG